MKKKMGLQELAQYTYQGLKQQNILVTLSGGACVSIYTQNAYQSLDLDFIPQINVGLEKIKPVMESLGFTRKGRHFLYPSSDFFVEFPPPPLTVGDEVPQVVHEYVITTSLGKLGVRMLSPTDCVKDRLCGFFYWNDKQCLDQALLVAKAKKVDLKETKRWAEHERMSEKYKEFVDRLSAKTKA